ncbi:MAG: dienelactone hydrolase family protein, partial [Candidatus Acidiferrales bacterium]
MEISGEYVQLSVNDGTAMRAWTARPKDRGAHPGLLVFQEAFGVNAHIRDVADRFAREGFVAVAPELFHRTGAEVDVRYDDFPSAVPHMKALNDASMAADYRAAFDWLRGSIGAELPIFAVGYCMGGRAAFLAALTLPLAGAISYYGGGIAPNASNPGLLGRASGIQAPLLLFWGGR